MAVLHKAETDIVELRQDDEDQPVSDSYTLPMLPRMKRSELAFVGEFGLRFKQVAVGTRFTQSAGFSDYGATHSPRYGYVLRVGITF